MSDPTVDANLLIRRGQALRDAVADPGPSMGPDSERVPTTPSNQLPCPFQGATLRVHCVLLHN